MILLQENKKRRGSGKTCHTETMIHSETVKFEHNAWFCLLLIEHNAQNEGFIMNR
jgi:hypothetical protein